MPNEHTTAIANVEIKRGDFLLLRGSPNAYDAQFIEAGQLIGDEDVFAVALESASKGQRFRIAIKRD